MLNEYSDKKNNTYHLIFLFLLSLNYLVPIIFFGEITLFYHDALDSEIVYNHIIGKYYSGDQESLELFINGEINLNFLRRIYQPIIFLYIFFETELAYWLTDIIVKLTSYFSFFILSKKINNNIFACSLAACLFASLNIPTHNGLGIAILPYLVYLSLFKKNIKIKNYLVIIFFGLNSDLIFTIFAIPFLWISMMMISQKKFRIFNKRFITIFVFFIASILIANINLILLPLSEHVLHREEFFKEAIPNSKILITLISSLIKFSSTINFSSIFKIPFFVILPFIFITTLFSKNKKAINIFYLVLLIEIVLIFLNTEVFLNYYNNSKGLIRTLNFGYCSTILPLFYCLILIIILKINKTFFSKVFQIIVLASIILSQINTSITPFYKKYVLKENNYRNVYSFNGYYLYKDYVKFKNIVNKERVISLGIDPMIAIINNIGTVDGYHNIYPLDYKKKFRKIIEKELDQNNKFKNYYDNWGSRIYAITNDPTKILLNFNEIEKLGAKYIISRYNISNKKLKQVCNNCSKLLKLYLID